MAYLCRCFFLGSVCHKSLEGRRSCTPRSASSQSSPNAWRSAACRTGSHCSQSRWDSHPAGTLSSHQRSLLTGKDYVLRKHFKPLKWTACIDMPNFGELKVPATYSSMFDMFGSAWVCNISLSKHIAGIRLIVGGNDGRLALKRNMKAVWVQCLPIYFSNRPKYNPKRPTSSLRQ